MVTPMGEKSRTDPVLSARGGLAISERFTVIKSAHDQIWCKGDTRAHHSGRAHMQAGTHAGNL